MPNIIQSCETSTKTIPVDGTTTATITATVVNDAEPSDAQPDVEVIWDVTGPGELNPLSSRTDAKGKAITSLTANDNGTLTVTATTADDLQGKNVNVTAGENSMATKIQSITAEPTSIPADGSVSALVTAVVTDGTTAQPQVEVTWTVSDGGSAKPTTSTTDENGHATTQVSASKSGILTITATTADDTTGKNAHIIADKALAAPVVLNANDDDHFTLNQYDIALGVTARIPLYEGAQAGHIVTFHWGGHQIQKAIQDPLTDLPMDIDVSEQMPPETLLDGTYQVYYVATDQANNSKVSSGLSITIAQGGETTPTLPAPEVPLADDGYINIDDVLNVVGVDISYEDMSAGDLVTLYWAAFDQDDRALKSYTTAYSLKVKEGDTKLHQDIDQALLLPTIDTGYEGYVNVFYTVQKEGSTDPLVLSYTKVCHVDTVSPKS